MVCPDEDTLSALADGLLTDAELVAVDAHLDSCRTCRQILVDHTKAVRSDGHLPGESTFIRKGSVIGRFVILEPLGIGGMGVVCSAYDPQLDRKVAVKILKPSSVADESVAESSARLIREAKAMARLAHPNVIAVHEVGSVGSQVFIAMELVEGGSLTQWLRDKQRGWRQIRSMLVQAGRGLAAAHQAGLIHRDFKPDNVLVGGDGRVRVIDFGLARTVEEHAAQPVPLDLGATNPRLTQSGVVLGTPCYMAPEQLDGRPADEKSDQFSFCITLYEALCGTRPYQGASVDELRFSMERGVPEIPADKDVPGFLWRLLLRGLNRDPNKRFPSMEVLLAELERDPFAKRSRAMGITGLAVACTLTLWGAYAVNHRSAEQLCQGAPQELNAVWNPSVSQEIHQAFMATGRSSAESAWQRVEHTLRIYGEEWAAMRTQACRATRIQGTQSDEVLGLRMTCLDIRLRELKALVEVFTTNVDAKVVENASGAANQLRSLRTCEDVDSLRAPDRMPEDPSLRQAVGHIQESLAHAKALTLAGRYQQAVDVTRELIPRVKRLGFRPLEADVLYSMGVAQGATGSHSDAIQTLESAALAAHAGHADEIGTRAYLELVGVNFDRRNRTDGAHWMLYASAAVERLGPGTLLEGDYLYMRGLNAFNESRLNDAMLDLVKAEPIMERQGNVKGLSDVRSVLGTIHAYLGDTQRAVELLESALDLSMRLHGKEHPRVTNVLNNLGAALIAAGDFEQALQTRLETWRMRQALLGDSHPKTAWSRACVGDVLLYLGRHREALEEIQAGLATLIKVHGPRSTRLVPPLYQSARALMHLERIPEALDAAHQALTLVEQGDEPAHAMAGGALGALGEIYLHQHEPGTAQPYLQRAVFTFEQAQSYPDELAHVQWLLARALWEGSRDAEGAILLATQARERMVMGGLHAYELTQVDELLARVRADVTSRKTAQ